MNEACYKINSICNDPEIREVIKMYPKRELGFKQRVFLSLIFRRKVLILYFVAKTKH